MNIQAKGFEQVKKALRGLPAAMYPKVKAVFKEYAVDLMALMVRTTKGGSLKSRTGQLSKNWRIEVGGFNLKTLFSEVSNSTPYAAIHQFGGVIRAKSAKYLTIPLPAMKTASGVTKMTAQQAFTARHTFIQKTKKGNLVIFENRGKNKKGTYRPPTPLFVLKKSVKIPKRLSFYEIAERLAKRTVDKLRTVLGGT